MHYHRKASSTVEAIEWTGENLKDVQAFMFPASPLRRVEDVDPELLVVVETYGARTRLTFAAPGQYIVREAGLFYVFTADEFNRQFETREPEGLVRA